MSGRCSRRRRRIRRREAETRDGGGTEPPRRNFLPPSVEEVSAYCHERKSKIDPQRFVDYYTSNGWRVGKNAMKDWKAAVRTWEKNDVNFRTGSPVGGTSRANGPPRGNSLAVKAAPNKYDRPYETAGDSS